jgi:hypothetical protein
MARAAEPLGLAVSGDGMLSSLLPPLAAREPVAAVIPIQIQAQPKLVYRRSGRRPSLSTQSAPIKAMAKDEQVMSRVMFNFVIVF